MQEEPNLVTFWVPFQGPTGKASMKRSEPTGGWAKRIPRKAATPLSSCSPFNLPSAVSTKALGEADTAATRMLRKSNISANATIQRERDLDASFKWAIEVASRRMQNCSWSAVCTRFT